MILKNQKETKFIRELEKLFRKYDVHFEESVLCQELSEVQVKGNDIEIRVEDLNVWRS